MAELFEFLGSSPAPVIVIVIGVILAGALFFEEYFGFKPRKDRRQATGAIGIALIVLGVGWWAARPAEEAANGASTTGGAAAEASTPSSTLVVASRGGLTERVAMELVKLLNAAGQTATTGYWSETEQKPNDRIGRVVVDYDPAVAADAELVRANIIANLSVLKAETGLEPLVVFSSMDAEEAKREPRRIRVFLEP